MQPNNQLDPTRLRTVLWGAQLASVAIMTALAWWLPELISIQAIPDARLPLLVTAVLAIPVVVVAARLLGIHDRGASLKSRVVPAAKPEQEVARAELGRYIVVIALAELPVILGFAYVFCGGDRSHALILGMASAGLMFMFRPRAARSVSGTYGS